MSDYLIDINIYRLVLRNYILKLRLNFLNRDRDLYNKIVGFKLIKTHKITLNEYDPDDQIDMLNIYYSTQLKQYYVQ